jgi:hypothetical protein
MLWPVMNKVEHKQRHDSSISKGRNFKKILKEMLKMFF